MGERLARRFPRSEPRRRAVEYLRGLPSDAVRREEARIPEGVASATKPRLAERMFKRACEAVVSQFGSGSRGPGTGVGPP